MHRRAHRVLILAGDTDGNIGDRAIVRSTCEELRRLDPGVRITLPSARPGADEKFFDVAAVRRGLSGLPSLIRAARRSDLILCGGGGLFQDDTSLVKMPYWAAKVVLARVCCRNVVGYSLGVGPLSRKPSRLAARLAFACMREVSVRDEYAAELVRRLTGKPVSVVPDPALLLTTAPAHEAERVLAAAGLPFDGAPIVGVAVRRWFHHRATLVPHKYAVRFRPGTVRGQRSCDRLTSLLARGLDQVTERHGAHVLFMPTYNVSHEADDLICAEVARKMRTGRSALVRISDPRLYKAVCGRLAVMLGGRMHPTILAGAMGTPVVGLAYNRKFRGFFRLLGCEENVIPVEEFVRREMTEELVRLLESGIAAGPGPPPKLQSLTDTTRRFTQKVLAFATPAGAPSNEPAVRRGSSGL